MARNITIMVLCDASANKWTGSISSYSSETRIDWFIEAEDNSSLAIEYPSSATKITYTILNRAPVVEITYPIGGENINTTSLNITWTASDPDNDDLEYNLKYSFDNISWKPIASGITETSYVWDLTEIKKSNSALIKVIATDEFGAIDEAITPNIFSISKSGMGFVSILIISVIALTSITVLLRKQKRR